MDRHDLRRERERLGTQEAVAGALGVSTSTIRKQETGQSPFRPVYLYAVRGLALDEHEASASRPSDGGPETAAR